jgi:hypothetical protein
MFKDAFYQLKKIRPNELWVLGLFLDVVIKIFVCHYHEEQFKVGNIKPFDVNPLTKQWITFFLVRDSCKKYFVVHQVG